MDPAVAGDVAGVVPDAEWPAAAPDRIGSADTALAERVEADAAPATVAPIPAEQVLIEIDPSVSAGFINNRYDLEVRGSVVASSPVEEVALLHADAVASRVQYGPPRPSQRIVLGDGVIVTRHVFTLSLPRSRTSARGTCDIALVVRTASGGTHRQAFALAIDPLLPTQVRVQSGPTRPSADYGGELTPVVLFVERAALDDSGYLQLVGWAVSLSPMVAIQVFAGEERVSSPRLGTRRDDVANVFPSYPNALHSGFLLSTPLREEMRTAATIRAQAICADGFAHEVVVPLERVARIAHVVPPAPPPTHRPSLGPPQAAPTGGGLPRQDPVYRLVTGFSLSPDIFDIASSYGGPVATPMTAAQPRPQPEPPPSADAPDSRRVIHHFCDTVSLSNDGEIVVDGWAVCAIGVAGIEVWVDEQRVGDAELGVPREDVGEQYPTIQMARHSGFRFTARVSQLPDGEHRVRVVLRNGLDDTAEVLSSHYVEHPRAPPIIEAPPEFRFELDSPSVVNDAVVDPVTGRLTIEGWVLSRSGVAEMVVWLDDQRLGEAHCGLARQDVGNAFPDWPNALRSGYAFHCPPRSLRNGAHTVTISVRAQNGEAMRRSFRIDVRKPAGSDETMTIRRRMTLVETDVLTEALAQQDAHLRFRLVLRQNGPIEAVPLARTVASLGSQVYRDWRLIALAEDTDSAAQIRTTLAEQPAAIAGRVTVIDAGSDQGADATLLDTPFGADDATDQTVLFGLLCPGDELGCDALMQFALASGRAPAADLLYADETRISPVSRDREPFCKPDFSPDLLLSTNYIGRPWFATPALLAKAEVTPRALLRDAEYDIVLRCTEQATKIHHVAKLLCRRGAEALDSDRAARGALRRAATRRGIQAEVLETPVPGTFRFRRRKRATGKVSIIIPTCAAHGHIETCIRTLRNQTAYRNFEIICVDNIPGHQFGWKRWLRDNADKVVDVPDAFNWSRFNNRAAEVATGDYLLFLNDDVEVIDRDWLDALLDHAQRPEVGITGAQLLYPGGKVQHAGMFLATGGKARHAFRFAVADEPGYFGLALTQRNVIAVTGACLLVRRDVFDSVGRFDEAHDVVNNDLDFCLRVHQAGLLTVYTPYARLIHHELASRDQVAETFDTSHFEKRWKSLFTAGDPYFNPLLSRHADDYRPDEEMVEPIFAGHPLFRPDDIKHILVVKLDHIGDFITALPAMRRLKQHFPLATIHVLAARGARVFAEAEACIDDFIEFEFFHARSGLGQKDLTEDDYAALHARLLPYGFDLAIDLRKHADTREALRHVPARFLAGYDHMGQFTFLDIALEWEGDKNLHRKRAHVTDDLINLVEAVATAGMDERCSLTTPTWPAPALPDFLSAEVRTLFAKPVVAVHPGVGTVMRQWPAEHFAALIDLLVESEDVNIVILGGPDEVTLVDEVLAQVGHHASVTSVAGRTSLPELGLLLASCAMYVGNNSGPKHIAAAIGVPTIGVHSGVIDAIEWAPIGKRALALRRDMTCSPCYLARLQDCPRNLACLRQFEPASVWQACRTLLMTGRAMVPTFAAPVSEAPPAEFHVKAPPRGRRREQAADAAPVAPQQEQPAAAEMPSTPDVTPKPVAAAPTSEPAPRGRKRSTPKPAKQLTPTEVVAVDRAETRVMTTDGSDVEASSATVVEAVVEEPVARSASRSRTGRDRKAEAVTTPEADEGAATVSVTVAAPEATASPETMPVVEEPTSAPAPRSRNGKDRKAKAASTPKPELPRPVAEAPEMVEEPAPDVRAVVDEPALVSAEPDQDARLPMGKRGKRHAISVRIAVCAPPQAGSRIARLRRQRAQSLTVMPAKAGMTK
ncbi:MAG TPA: glycosyltransferase family 9 protein [Acetobacteraceae bacterium]|nr:glycosyltransferase family 9 protein [Acetobacteraceae bacterium]